RAAPSPPPIPWRSSWCRSASLPASHRPCAPRRGARPRSDAAAATRTRPRTPLLRPARPLLRPMRSSGSSCAVCALAGGRRRQWARVDGSFFLRQKLPGLTHLRPFAVRALCQIEELAVILGRLVAIACGIRRTRHPHVGAVAIGSLLERPLVLS